MLWSYEVEFFIDGIEEINNNRDCKITNVCSFFKLSIVPER